MGWLQDRKIKKQLKQQQNIVLPTSFNDFLTGVNNLKQGHNNLIQENAMLKVEIRKLTNEKQKLIDELTEIKRIINGIK